MHKTIIYDGGRRKAGYKGVCNDCAIRAMAIITGISYRKVLQLVKEKLPNFSLKRKDFNLDHTLKYVEALHQIYIEHGYFYRIPFDNRILYTAHDLKFPVNENFVLVQPEHHVVYMQGNFFDNGEIFPEDDIFRINGIYTRNEAIEDFSLAKGTQQFKMNNDILSEIKLTCRPYFFASDLIISKIQFGISKRNYRYFKRKDNIFFCVKNTLENLKLLGYSVPKEYRQIDKVLSNRNVNKL